MRISPGYIHSRPINQNSSVANGTKKIDGHANAVGNKNLISKLVNKKELLELSKSLKNGQITNNDARRCFIDFVSRKSLGDKISAKDMDLLIKDIDNFFSHDQDFLNNLVTNLKMLS